MVGQKSVDILGDVFETFGKRGFRDHFDGDDIASGVNTGICSSSSSNVNLAGIDSIVCRDSASFDKSSEDFAFDCSVGVVLSKIMSELASGRSETRK